MSSRSVQVRFPSDVWMDMQRALSDGNARHEPVAFGLVSAAETRRHDLVLVREIIAPPEEAFLPSQGHGARWSGAYTIDLMNRALAEDCGLFVLHSHGRARAVQMSSDDRSSAAILLPKFQQIAPDRPHGSLVFGHRCAAGMIALPKSEGLSEDFSVRVFGSRVLTYPEAGTADELELLERQPIAENEAVSRLLAETTVAVVGLSGGGTQVLPHLAAQGIGTIIGIDPQRVDRSNGYASSQIGWLDRLLRPRKTSLARRLSWIANRRTRFVPIRVRIPEAAALEALKTADIVVGCVNNMHGREDLMDLCWRYCIPYVDVGLSVSVETPWDSPGAPPISGIHGNVFVAVPGSACMWCTEFLTQARLDAETDGRGRSYLRDTRGDKNAWVLSFNGVLASHAASEVLQLLVGYAPADIQRTYRRFDGYTGTLTECIVRRSPGCRMCNHVLAIGDPVWR